MRKGLGYDLAKRVSSLSCSVVEGYTRALQGEIDDRTKHVLREEDPNRPPWSIARTFGHPLGCK